MYVAHKSNQILSIDDKKWDCRRKAKGIKTHAEYWTWEKSITDSEGVINFPSEDFTIVEVRDEDERRIEKLMSYISFGIDFPSYNIKYYVSKRNAEEILNPEGKSYSPKQYVSSHFVGDDTAKDKRILDQKWADIRTERNRLLTESDWVVVKAKETHANASIPSDWVDYRTELRDITKQSDPDDITWPTKP